MEKRTRLAACLSVALIVVTLAVYWKTGGHEFVNYDDDEYVYNNPQVMQGFTGAGIIWAFTTTHVANWHPLTWLSHMADVEFHGMNPRGHHLSSVFLHAAASVLLFLLLFRLTASAWRSAFVAALFALHPLHVQSVAWVAERKDVLSALFWFLTLLLYASYAAGRRPLHYRLALGAFVLGLMAKPMLITVPLTLLLIDFWPLRRFDAKEPQAAHDPASSTRLPPLGLLKEKIPFLACSLLSAAITIYAQHKAGATVALDALPVVPRLENALVAYMTYLGLTFWPRDLAVFYPLPISFPWWQSIGAMFVLLLVSAATIRVRRQHPYLLVGWLWFLLTLVPVIGVIQVGMQSMADRYTYIPLIGLFIMAAWGVPALAQDLRHRQRLLALLAVTVIAASAVGTWQQLDYWRDGVSLFRRAIQITSNNHIMHNSLGVALKRNGDLDAAVREYRAALAIKPDFAEARNNLGLALGNQGDLDAEIGEYRKALAIKPDLVEARSNLGVALATKGDLDAAIRELRQAVAARPDFADAHTNLGLALDKAGDIDGAIAQYRSAVALAPGRALPHLNLGTALGNTEDWDAAIKELQQAIAIDPKLELAHLALGIALGGKGDMNAAIAEFRAVVAINPASAAARFNLGTALLNKGDLDGAIAELRAGLVLAPDHAGAQSYLEFALERKRSLGAAGK